MTSAKPQYWLLKSEPDVFSFAQLQKDKRTNWNGVRNFQARNFLKAARIGDLALIYHSNDDRAAVGIARVVREAYPDQAPDDDRDDWVQIDVAPVEPLKRPVTLQEMKASGALKDLLLIKQSRLSVSPLTKTQYEFIVKLSSKAASK